MRNRYGDSTLKIQKLTNMIAISILFNDSKSLSIGLSEYMHILSTRKLYFELYRI